MSSVSSTKGRAPRFVDTFFLKFNRVHAAWWYYVVVFLTVGIAVGFERLFPLIFSDYDYVLFWSVIVFNAWYGGVLTGSAATVLSLLAAEYFIEQPIYHLSFEVVDVVALFVGIGISVLINVPNARSRRMQAALEQQYAALRESEERFRGVLENMPVLLSVNDEHGQRVFWNKEAERVTGFTAEEVIDNPNLPDLLYPDKAYQAAIERFRRERPRDWRNWELTTQRKDGDKRIISWSNISKHYSIPGWYDWALGIDITASVQARKRTETLQAITTALSAAVTPVQVSQIILEQCMPAIDASAGVIVQITDDQTSLEIVLNRGFTPQLMETYQRFPLEANVPIAAAARERKPVWLRTLAERDAAYPVWVGQETQNQSWASLPLVVEDRVLGALGFSFAQEQDFSADERTFMMVLANQCAQALERARLFEAESDARKEAEQANALKLQFLGMISHELRTPLSSIKGFASTLLAEDVQFDLSSQREFLTVIDQESDRLSELVAQLLDLARLQASSMSIQQERQRFETIVEAAAPSLKTLTTYHTLVMDVPGDLPAVLADTRRVEQVILNLVSNAARYAPPQTTISVRAFQAGEMLQVDVHDEGPGIPASERTRVFEAFRQGDGELERRSQGVGLGLAICKGLIEAHGGTIWIQDTPPPGTTISFTLPLADA